MPNILYCGDNLRVLREEIRPESVDLVYLDPPFNSQEDYSVIYREADGSKPAAQVQVFEDTWQWNEMSALAFYQTVSAGGTVSDALQGFEKLLGKGRMLAYLSMMAPRLVELHGALKTTGSLYLHCDPAASHYLKVLLDAVFGPARFRNELVWQRTSAHNDPSRYGRVHDVLLFYVKGTDWTWNEQFDAPDADYFKSHDFERDSEGRLYRKRDLTAPAHGQESGQYEWKGRRPPRGRMWSYTEDNMRRLEGEGRVVYTKTGMPRLKIYAEALKGVPYQDVWARPDLWLNSGSGERLGYPTQKPKALLERIIRASSNEGDVVLDPFCGCGTTIDAAQGLKRQWIGIDVTHLAISVIRSRLKNEYPDVDVRVAWIPTSEAEARKLAAEDPFQFQCWVLGELGINPLYQKKGADRGVDGRLFFFEAGGAASTTPAQIVFSVKGGGHLTPAFVRDLAGVVQRERAQIGVLVTLEKPTREMVKEAASAAPFRAKDGSLYPGLQLLTVKDILEGGRVEHPAGRSLSFPDAKMARAAAAAAAAQQPSLKFG